MDFWDRLRDSIRDCDHTHESVARKLKIPLGTFKNWLLRKTYPDAKEIVEIAGLLNTTAEYLVNGEEEAGSVKVSEEDRRLISSYHQLSKYDKGLLLLIIEAWNRKYK